MANNSTVKLVLAGDAGSLEKAAARAEKSIDGVKSHAEKAGHSTAELGEKFEQSTKHIRGGRDALDGASTALTAFGGTVPGPISGVLTLGMGLADLSDGIGTTVLPMLSKLKVAMLATLGPWGLALVAIAAVTAAFVVAYKKSETFRDIIHKVGDVAGKIFSAIKSGVEDMGRAFAKVATALATPYREAFNLIADAWNNTIGKLHFKIPGWVPGIGGNGFDVPNLPHFANGGQTGGLALVGERGPELIAPPIGSRVIPANQSRTGGGTTVVLQVQGDSSDFLVQAIRKAVRVKGGGDVQMAFGR